MPKYPLSAIWQSYFPNVFAVIFGKKNTAVSSSYWQSLSCTTLFLHKCNLLLSTSLYEISFAWVTQQLAFAWSRDENYVTNVRDLHGRLRNKLMTSCAAAAYRCCTTTLELVFAIPLFSKVRHLFQNVFVRWCNAAYTREKK